MLKISGHLK